MSAFYSAHSIFSGSRLWFFFPEVVLSLLLTSFEFEDAGKSIKWRMSRIVSPVAEGKDHARSELPMILTRSRRELYSIQISRNVWEILNSKLISEAAL